MQWLKWSLLSLGEAKIEEMSRKIVKCCFSITIISELVIAGHILCPSDDSKSLFRSLSKCSSSDRMQKKSRVCLAMLCWYWYFCSTVVKPRFLNTICSGRLFKNRFVRKPNHIFPLQIIKKRLICSIHQKNNLFTWLHYTRGGQLFWPAGRIAVMEAS